MAEGGSDAFEADGLDPFALGSGVAAQASAIGRRRGLEGLDAVHVAGYRDVGTGRGPRVMSSDASQSCQADE